MSDASPIPTVLAKTIEPTVEAFLKPEHVRLQNIMISLIQRNHALGGHPYGFFHNGRLFSPVGPAKLRGHKIQAAHTTVRPEAEDLVQKREKLKEAKLRLSQAMIVIASRCTCEQDFRDSLPEPLVECSPYAHLRRHRDEGAVLEHYPMLRAQLQKTVRIVLYYSANRLLY